MAAEAREARERDLAEAAALVNKVKGANNKFMLPDTPGVIELGDTDTAQPTPALIAGDVHPDMLVRAQAREAEMKRRKQQAENEERKAEARYKIM